MGVSPKARATFAMFIFAPADDLSFIVYRVRHCSFRKRIQNCEFVTPDEPSLSRTSFRSNDKSPCRLMLIAAILSIPGTLPSRGVVRNPTIQRMRDPDYQVVESSRQRHHARSLTTLARSIRNLHQAQLRHKH